MRTIRTITLKLNNMLNKFKIITAALVFTTLISCSKDKKDDTVVYKTTLSGANEVPANTSLAKGNATLIYNKGNKTFTIETSYSGLRPVAGHIHKAAAGTNGPVIFPFPDVAATPIKTSGSLTAAQLLALDKDSMYVNIHTTDFPGGEIRGQLKKQ